MKPSKKSRKIIGVSGNRGSFSELAALDYLHENGIDANLHYLIDIK